MKFGEKVRDLRKKHSLTQDELAQCLGINKRTIIGWERDGRYPRSVEMLEKMADIFHVPLTYLQPDQSLFIERAAEAYGKKGKGAKTDAAPQTADQLRKAMREAAARLDFVEAARLRDQLLMIEKK